MPPLVASRYRVSEHYRFFRLDRFLQAMIPKLSRSRIQSAIRSRVEVSWHPRPRPSLSVVPGGEVRVYFPEVIEPEIPAWPRILYEDDSILAVDKPAGLLVHPTHSCLKNNLIHLLREMRPGAPLALAHRLDRDTSGVILLTRTQEAARAMARKFERREIEKSYVAVVQGRMAPSSGRIDAPLGVSQRLQVIFRRSVDGKKAQGAVTDFRVLARGASVSLVLLRPRTGRRHQLRAHLASVGHPIAGDKLYALSDRDYLKHLRGKLDEAARRSVFAERQLLHAFRLRFDHPATGRSVTFTSPLPADIHEFLGSRGVEIPEGWQTGAAPNGPFIG